MKNRTETIRKIVTQLNNEEANGGFWLPNIQRPFVWKEEQIERLFDSLMRKYPISTLLVWKTKSNIKHRKFIDNYSSSIRLTHYYVPENEKPKLLVLDGQQRLQSLFIGLCGSYEGKELYLDILSGDLAAPEDIRFRFKFLDKNKAAFPFVKFKELVFSEDRINRLSDKITANCNQQLTQEQEDRIEDNVAQMFHVFREQNVVVYQELDSIDSPESYTENDVVEIFIRANDGGTKLGKSDLLFSLLTSSWEDSEEQMEDLLDDLNREGYRFTRDFVLKSCLTMLGKGARYDVAKFRDGTTKESIIENWEELSSAIKDVKDFLYGKTFIRTDKALPSYLGLIPLIYFRYAYPKKWKSIKNINDYILRTLLTGSFSGTPDNLIDKCVNHIKKEKTFNVDEMFGIIRADGRNLDVTAETILNRRYGSKDIHILFNMWYEQFNYTPAFSNNIPQVDHIFPQSYLRTVKDENPETGALNVMRYKARDRDQIGNCMLLTAVENGAGGKTDTLPEDWFADKSDEYLDMHLIPKNKVLWKAKNFEKFIKARNKLILEKFDHMLI